MKAFVLEKLGEINERDVEKPTLKKDWVLVKTAFTGICSSDIPRIYTNGAYHYPLIPGHEFSGRVQEVFDKENLDLIGRNVGIFPLIPCKKCSACLDTDYEMCSNYNYLGSRCDGGFAEYVLVPIWNLVVLDQKISLRQASILEPFSVAIHAIKKANFNRDMLIAVNGTGAIGMIIAGYLIANGYKNVILLARNENKREIASKGNIKEYIIKDKDSITSKFDVIFEAVGTNDSLIESIDMVRENGQIILMGNPEGDMMLPKNLYWKILRKQLSLKGTWNSSYNNKKSDWNDAVKCIANGKFDPTFIVTHQFKFDNLKKGLDIMRDKKEIYGKVLIEF